MTKIWHVMICDTSRWTQWNAHKKKKKIKKLIGESWLDYFWCTSYIVRTEMPHRHLSCKMMPILYNPNYTSQLNIPIPYIWNVSRNPPFGIVCSAAPMSNWRDEVAWWTASQARTWKQNLTSSWVLSSDKSQCFDSVGPLYVIHCSPLTPHNK